MRRTLICKVIQKQTYDVISQKHFVICSLIGLFLLGISAFRFGEVFLEWSKEKYAAVFNSFSDNIMGKSYQAGLCQHVPIDVVYTWVNGSDPKLLKDLSSLRQKLLLQSNKSSSSLCHYSLCVQAPIVILQHNIPHDLNHMTMPNVLETLRLKYQFSKKVHNVTALLMDSLTSTSAALQSGHILVAGQNVSVWMTFVTSDSSAHNTVVLENMVMISAVPSRVSELRIKEKLSEISSKGIRKIYMYEDKSLALVSVTDKSEVEKLIKHNITLDGRLSRIGHAYLAIQPLLENEDISSSRFADNDELKYSLRSVEKHAPWVRHIYVVTNGQIPSWLNLDNQRISIISHEEIFPEKTHLPTFSSPAIEAHLHRIPNLSNKFLYLNDDVMFGKEVWPEDFYTYTKGQKVRLAWPVPDCAEGCPSSWIRDGYCDKACNNSQCQWDGGDCSADKTATVGLPGLFAFPKGELPKMYCSASCANSWLSDKYCDQACNVFNCAFDAGDCGTQNFHLLYGKTLLKNRIFYTLPQGTLQTYFNLTGFLDDSSTITEGSYKESKILRVMAISLKHKVLTLLLFPDHNTTNIQITLKGKKGDTPYEFKFSVTANTHGWRDVQVTPKPTVVTPKKNLIEPSIDFEEFSPDDRFPPTVTSLRPNFKYGFIDFERSDLSNDTKEKIKEVQSLFSEGIITKKGLQKKISEVVEDYVKSEQSKGSQPRLVFQGPAVESIPQEVSKGKVQRKLLSLSQSEDVVPVQPDTTKGHFPWEKQGLFDFWTEEETEPYRMRLSHYRKLLDTFGDSLRHVNKLFNDAFGYETRKVPSHMAHLIDVNLVRKLQARFPEEFRKTSSHKIRSSNDMQFAFSYFYFLMSETEPIETEELFDQFDVDRSGTWSDREIRTVVTHLFDLPVDPSSVQQVENHLLDCAKNISYTSGDVSTPPYERYVDSVLPTIKKSLVVQCKQMLELLRKKYKTRKVNRFEIIGEDDFAFKMIHTNVSQVLAQMDELRSNPKKFICLNDNIDHSSKDATMVRVVLHDFYESMFPVRSQFELPPEYRNRFLYLDELREWRKYKNVLRLVTYVSLLCLILFTAISFCGSDNKQRNTAKQGRCPSLV